MAKSKPTPEEKKILFEAEVKIKVKKMSEEEMIFSVYMMEKEMLKRKVVGVLNKSQFNSKGMRDTLSEITDEVIGS